MTYRDILVQIDEKPASQARAEGAAALASHAKAKLTGVFLKSNFLKTYTGMATFTDIPPLNLNDMIQKHATAVGRASEAARAVFEQAAARVGVESEWAEIDGDDSKALIAHGRRCDLTVFPTAARACLGDHQSTAAGLAMAIGGPVLIVPEAGLSPTADERVLLAWNGSREAARALRDAMPLLTRAKQAFVLIVSPEGAEGSEARLQRHLERHGAKAEVIVDRSADSQAGDILRRQVKALDIGILAMGVYGRSRLEESILGGVSREMTEAPPCGLLISH